MTPAAASSPTIASLPTADAQTVLGELAGRPPAVFLDYDGVLTPIVKRPEDAVIDDAVRDVLRGLARACTVAIVSGRDLADVQALVGVEGLVYAGSHGFDIVAADGTPTQHGAAFLPALDEAEAALRSALLHSGGARLERKRFAIAVHVRQVAPDDVGAVETAVRTVAADHADLKVTGGKQVFELRPDVEWDKGAAVLWLLGRLGLDDGGTVPIYIGDDVTDEDAFRALASRGIGLVVRGEDDQRPTAAAFALDDTTMVVALLAALRDRLEE